MQLLADYAERVNQVRLDGLFGNGTDDLADAVDASPEATRHHFLIALSLLEQAQRHLLLANLECHRGS